jgi:hypothetical protein
VNFLALVQRAHRERGISTPAPTSVVGATDRNQRTIDAVAAAWDELQAERPWRWMRATTDTPLTAGQQTYTSAQLGIVTRFGRWREEDSDYSPILYVAGSLNTLWQLQYWDLDNFRKLFIYRVQASTTPIAWTYDESNQFLVGSNPALAYQLRAEYWKEPVALAADADTPDMPDRFHMILVWRALQDLAKFDAAPEHLARAEKNYGDLYDKLLFDQARLPSL